MGDVGDDPCLPGGDRFTDALSCGENLPTFFEVIGLKNVTCLLRLHRLWPGLDDKAFAGLAVLRPLDIHGHRFFSLRRVVILDRERIPGERQDIVVADAEPPLVGVCDINDPGGLPGAPMTVDHLHPLLAHVPPDDRTVALPERRFEDVELIRVDGTLDDHLPEPVGTGYEDDVPESGIGVEREYDPASGEVGSDHLHDPDREGDLEVVEVVVDPVGDRSIGEERGKTPDERLLQSLVATDVQVGLLLTRKRGRREVFGGCGAPDRDVGIRSVLIADHIVGGTDLVPEVIGDFGREDQVAGPLSSPRKIGDVVSIKPGEGLFEVVEYPCGVEDVPVALRGHGKPIRDLHALRGQLTVHLAERCVLPADETDILVSDIDKPADIFSVLLHLLSPPIGATATR